MENIKTHLEKLLNRSLVLTITDNSTNVISVAHKNSTIYLRLNKIFLKADVDVIAEIAEFIKHRRCKTPSIREFVRINSDKIKKKPPRRINTRTEGRYYNLQDIYNSLNSEYFNERISARLTWWGQNKRRFVRQRRLGSYSIHTNIIRINSMLDKKKIPRYFLEYIVYHEMLHADFAADKKNKYRIHSKEFKERERLFKYYERAIAWENNKG